MSEGPEISDRLYLALCAVDALDADEQHRLYTALCAWLAAGPPVPPLDGIVAEAEDWAEWSTPPERSAYLRAIWRRMPDASRSRFLGWVNNQNRAAG